MWNQGDKCFRAFCTAMEDICSVLEPCEAPEWSDSNGWYRADLAKIQTADFLTPLGMTNFSDIVGVAKTCLIHGNLNRNNMRFMRRDDDDANRLWSSFVSVGYHLIPDYMDETNFIYKFYEHVGINGHFLMIERNMVVKEFTDNPGFMAVAAYCFDRQFLEKAEHFKDFGDSVDVVLSGVTVKVTKYEWYQMGKLHGWKQSDCEVMEEDHAYKSRDFDPIADSIEIPNLDELSQSG